MIQLMGACDTYTYTHIHADIVTCMSYERVISDMHSAVSRAYVGANLYASFSDTYKICQFVSVLYLYVFLADMHMQVN
jgi:hypothetical protein